MYSTRRSTDNLKPTRLQIVGHVCYPWSNLWPWSCRLPEKWMPILNSIFLSNLKGYFSNYCHHSIKTICDHHILTIWKWKCLKQEHSICVDNNQNLHTLHTTPMLRLPLYGRNHESISQGKYPHCVIVAINRIHPANKCGNHIYIFTNN